MNYSLLLTNNNKWMHLKHYLTLFPLYMYKHISQCVATQHIAIRYILENDRIKSEEINIKWISTNEMISDILTKPPKGAEFKELRGLLLNL